MVTAKPISAVTDGATLSVLLGNGNATFQNGVSYLVGAGAAINGTLAVGDFNGDLKPDLVTSSRDGLAVFINTGNGGFQPAIPYAPFLGGAIAVGDFNGADPTVAGSVGDGRPDIVAADSSQDSTTTDTIAVIGNQSTEPQVTVTVQTSPPNLPFSVYYEFPPGGGPISEFVGCETTCTYNSGFGLWFQIYATPAIAGGTGVQYALDHFSDSGFTAPDCCGDFIHDVQALAVPVNVTIYYRPQYQITVVASPSQGGVVSPASGAFYDSGGNVSLSAIANPGYTFVQWTGVITLPSGPATLICPFASCTVPVVGPTTWTATFASQTLAVPNVLGISQAAASAAITSAGLVIGNITSASSTSVPSGDVISESPLAGTMVSAGSAVNLVISSGPPADTTPPVIVPQVVGTSGNNGWYLSSASVQWSVTDPDSGIASSTGCGPINLNATTSGTTLTCTASNGAGLSKSVSITIRIDLTHPSLSVPNTLTVTATSSAGAPVTYAVTASDAIDPNPVVTCLPASGSTFAVGTTAVNCTAIAVSGSRSTATFNVIIAAQQTGGPADLAVDNLALPMVRTKQTLTYFIEVTNLGPNVASQVALTDVLPPGTTLVSASWVPESCTIVRGSVSCSIPSTGIPCASLGSTVSCGIGVLTPLTLRNPTGALVRLVVQVTAAPGSIIRNTSTVSAVNTDGNIRNNSSAVTTRVIR